MKKNNIFFILSFLYSTLFSQVKLNDDIDPKNKKSFFPKDSASIHQMQDNWGMYFRADVLSVLGPKVKNSFFEIKLDSYGSVYPAQQILAVIKPKEFEGELKDYKDLSSHTFYKRFKEDIESRIKNLVDADRSLTTEYKVLLEKSKNNDESAFSEIWDNLHTSKIIKELNLRIRDSSINRVIFFIPGYNVPYSLQVLQAITLFKIARRDIPEKENILFVPVYWPSNNAKFDSLYQDNFTTDNIKKFGPNGRLFLGYSNRCYFAAATLRKIINGLDDDHVKVDIISHSLGATIATSALINTYSKLQYNHFSRLKRFADDSARVVNKKNNSFHGKDNMNLFILKEFYKSSLPTRPINVFLSAAAIPGYSTFMDAKAGIITNKKIFVEINVKDEMLTKSEIKLQVKKKTRADISFINENHLGATTLGCEAGEDSDALETQLWLKKITGKDESFTYEIVTPHTDHDVFTYIQDSLYLNFLKRFFNEK